MRTLEQFLYEIDRDIAQSSKSRFISRSAEMQESIDEVNIKVVRQLSLYIRPTDFIIRR